jgi:hypothetical protein
MLSHVTAFNNSAHRPSALSCPYLFVRLQELQDCLVANAGPLRPHPLVFVVVPLNTLQAIDSSADRLSKLPSATPPLHSTYPQEHKGRPPHTQTCFPPTYISMHSKKPARSYWLRATTRRRSGNSLSCGAITIPSSQRNLPVPRI